MSGGGTSTRHVFLNSDWYTNNTPAQQIASTIHEALHVQMNMDDAELQGWLSNFGFKDTDRFSTGDITDWIAGGCKNAEKKP